MRLFILYEQGNRKNMFQTVSYIATNFIINNFHIILYAFFILLFIEWLVCLYRVLIKRSKSIVEKIIVVGVPLVIIWVFALEQTMLVTTRQDIYIKNLPDKFDNYKIVFITDLHAGSPFTKESKIKRVVNLANKQNGDLILIGGDYEVTGMILSEFVPMEKIAPLLKNLNSKNGTYSVLGNHDYFNGKTEIENQLRKNHIKVLENKTINIGTKTEPFYLAGLGDYDFGNADWTVTNNIPKDKPAIVLVHEPDFFPFIPDNIALTVSGHTHGGQIRIPFYGAIKTPSVYGNKYAKGLIKEGNKQLYISSGVGTSILPVRLFNPPEITVLTLKKD